MNIGQMCKMEVATVSKDCSIKEAAELMEKNKVGNVIVVENKDNNEQPCGILTDRDIVLKAVAKGKDAQTPVEEIMSKDLLCIPHDKGIKETIDMLRDKSVRRAPIVNEKNKVVGVAAVDDILPLLIQELCCLSDLIKSQLDKE